MSLIPAHSTLVTAPPGTGLAFGSTVIATPASFVLTWSMYSGTVLMFIESAEVV